MTLDRRALEQEILLSGFEDSTGLWETVWYLNGAAPGLPESVKIDEARAVLDRLLHMRAILLFRTEPGSLEEKELPFEDACRILGENSNWSTPDVVGQEFRYLNTEKGDQMLKKMWAEAQS